MRIKTSKIWIAILLVMIMIGSVKANVIDDILEFLGFGEKEQPKPELIEMDYGSDTYMNPDGTYSLILYSGVRNVIDSDGKWKRIENATSLKSALDSGLIKMNYFNKEDNLDFEVEELNYTYIKLKPINNNKKSEYIPIKVDDIGELNLNTKQNPSYRLEKNFDDSIFSHNFTFGKASTTITLSIADTENMDDAYVLSQNGNTNYGAYSNLGVLDSTTYSRETAIKFNISSIPSGNVIDEAQFYYYIQLNALDNGAEGYSGVIHRICNGYNISGSEWDETTITWNNRPSVYNGFLCLPETTVVYFGGTGEQTGWQNYTVTNIVSEAYSENALNVSLYINATDRYGTPDSTDIIWIYSKEQTGTTYDPYLNITYSEPVTTTTTVPPTTTTTTTPVTTTTVPPSTCNPPGDSDWIVDCSENCVKTVGWTNTGGYKLILTGSGTFTLESHTIYATGRIHDPNCLLIMDTNSNLVVG